MMRENIDFVSMKNYQCDMTETSDLAAAIIKQLRAELDRERMMLWLAIRAAGGKVSIPRESVEDFRREVAVLEMRDCQHNRTIELIAPPLGNQQSGIQ